MVSTTPSLTGIQNITSTISLVTNSSEIGGNDGDGDGGGYEFSFNTLEEICAIFDIASANCSCDIFQFADFGGVGTSFCNSNNEDLHVHSKTLDLALATVTTVACFIGVFGNLLVVAVRKTKGKKATRHQHLVNILALFDLLFAILNFVYILPTFWTLHWLYGEASCKVLQSSMSLGALLAVGIILTIAIERYIGIVHPLVKVLTLKKMYIIIVANVILGLVAVVIRVKNLTVDQNSQICGEHWGTRVDSVAYSWVIFFAYFIAPVAAISILYYKIFQSLNQSMLSLKSSVNSHQKNLNTRRLHDNRRTMVTLLTVLLVFVLFTLPNKLKWIIFDTFGTLNIKTNVYNAIYYTGEMMYSFHVAINPIVYTLVDKRFKRELKRVILTKCLRRHSQTSPTNSQRPGLSNYGYPLSPNSNSHCEETRLRFL